MSLVLPRGNAERSERAAHSRMKSADRRVTLVRSVRTQEIYLWDVEDRREVPPEEQKRK